MSSILFYFYVSKDYSKYIYHKVDPEGFDVVLESDCVEVYGASELRMYLGSEAKVLVPKMALNISADEFEYQLNIHIRGFCKRLKMELS